MSTYLRRKDYAKILYNLYKDVFNNCNVEEVELSPEITVKIKEKFSVCNITDEEKWAYGHNMVYLSDEPYLARIDSLRERNVPKQTFFLTVAIPVYRICVNPEPFVYSEKVMKFGFENGLFKRIASNEKELYNWFWIEGESIRTKDAEIIVGNIKKFLASRNC